MSPKRPICRSTRASSVPCAQVARGRPGDRLPSDTKLCASYGVSRMTARTAMQRLADRYGVDVHFDVERPDPAAAGETGGRPILNAR